MKYPTVKFVFDRKKVATKTKKGLIQIEVTSERKRKWIGTGVKVYADQWDDRKKVIKHEDCIQLNSMLDAQMSNVNSFIVELVKNNQPFDFEKLDAFLDKQTKSVSFLDFISRRIEERTDIAESTRKQHRTLLQSLESFGKIIYMDDLTKQNIILYDEWLHQKDIAQPTIYNYHKRLKRYIHEAMRFEMLESDPTSGLKFEKGKFEKRKYLTEEELRKVEICPVNSDSVNRVRDLFLFQCYTGLIAAILSL